VLRVPASAIRFRPRKDDRPEEEEDDKQSKPGSKRVTAIWVASDDRYRPVRRVVTLGLVGEDFVEIARGVKAGEKVLVRTRNLANEDKDEDDFASEGE